MYVRHFTQFKFRPPIRRWLSRTKPWYVILGVVLITSVLVGIGLKTVPRQGVRRGAQSLRTCNNIAEEYKTRLQGNQILYIHNCFFPRPLTIKKGESVIFTNMSDQPMWITSYSAGSSDELKGFNSGQAFDNGQSYGFTFSQKGKYGFNNKEKGSDKGAIVVE